MNKLFGGLLLCLTVLSGHASPQGHIVIQNQYFPKPGKEKEVYELRLHASEIITKLGVPRGRVLKRTNIGDRPYVMWECDYSSTKEMEKVVNLVSHSAEFKAVENKMEILLDRFEHLVWEIAE